MSIAISIAILAAQLYAIISPMVAIALADELQSVIDEASHRFNPLTNSPLLESHTSHGPWD